MTSNELSRRSGFNGNPIAEKGIEKWLDEAPSNFNVSLLDLFYWEHRLGVWGACGLTLREAAIDQIPPMNCREFIQLGLATDAGSRTKPYALIREIINETEPTLLNYPFNHSWRDFLTQTLLLPRRRALKKALDWRVCKYRFKPILSGWLPCLDSLHTF